MNEFVPTHFKPVPREQFFKAIGNLDSHPQVVMQSLPKRFIVSIFETPARMRLGAIVSDSHGSEPSQCFLCPTMIASSSGLTNYAREPGAEFKF